MNGAVSTDGPPVAVATGGAIAPDRSPAASHDRPVVSVCMPIYNGERYAAEAIRSVLAQTMPDFELIICDNASTDGTAALCRAFASEDPRVRYARSEKNRGLAWNFNRGVELARGRYLAWLAYDDVMLPDYLRACVEELERQSQAVLCFSNHHRIDGSGEITPGPPVRNTGEASTPSQRFWSVLSTGKCDAIVGVIRVDVLRRTKLHGAYADSDRVLLAELGLRGPFIKIDRPLFSRRTHQYQVTATKDLWARTVIFDPKLAGRLICPAWRELFALIGAVWRVGLSPRERWNACHYVYWWVVGQKKLLKEDLRRALRQMTGLGSAPS